MLVLVIIILFGILNPIVVSFQTCFKRVLSEAKFRYNLLTPLLPLQGVICMVIIKCNVCMESGHSTSSCARNKTIDRKITMDMLGCKPVSYCPLTEYFPSWKIPFLWTEDLTYTWLITYNFKILYTCTLDDLPKEKKVFAKVNKKAVFPVHACKGIVLPAMQWTTSQFVVKVSAAALLTCSPTNKHLLIIMHNI